MRRRLYARTRRLSRRIIRVTLGPRRIKCRKVDFVQGSVGLHARDKIRIGQQRTAKSDQVGLIGGKRLLRACTIEAAGEDIRPVECRTQLQLDRGRHRRCTLGRVIEHVQIQQPER